MTRPLKPTPDAAAYGYEQAAAYTGIGRTTLYHAQRTGQLRSIKVGRSRLFLRQDLDAFLAANIAAPAVTST